MTAPIDGIGGSIWRTVTLPARALAPFALLARRAIRGEYWLESVRTSAGTGPTPNHSNAPSVQTSADGTGPLNHRSYRVQIDHSELTAAELVEAFRRDPNEFCPASYATFVPDPAPDGLCVGEEYRVKLPGPWDGPVRVAEIGDSTIRLETLNGHMEAGSIEFSCTQLDDDRVAFHITSLARSGDEVFDVLYQRLKIGRIVQTEMWVQVLESAVAVSGGHQRGRAELASIIYDGAAT